MRPPPPPQLTAPPRRTLSARLTGRAFWDLAVCMVGLGLGVGLVFPRAIVMLGVPAGPTSTAVFRLSCVVCGVMVCGVNYWLARTVVGRRLRVLTARMRDASDQVRQSMRSGAWRAPPQPRLPVDSKDELGESAAAFNLLLDALDEEQRFRSLVQNSSDVISILEPDGMVRFITPSVENVLGSSAAEIVGQPVGDHFHPDDRRQLADYLRSLAERPGAAGAAIRGRMVRADGSWCNVESVAMNLLTDPSIRGIVLTTRDVTERAELEDQLRHLAFHDALTGLANRALFADRADHALVRSERDSRAVSLLFLDLDDFKMVNDSLGHGAGDKLLRAIADRLAASVRPGDTVARLGGDEFGILLEDGGAAAGILTSQRLTESLREPFVLGDLDVFVRASIGVAVAESGDTTDDLLRNADTAMYAAKAAGKGCARLFDPVVHARS